MNKSVDLNIETFPKEGEKEKEEKEEEEKEHAELKEKDKENENISLNNNEFIELFYHNIKIHYGIKFKIILIIIILLFIFLIFAFLFFPKKKVDCELLNNFKELQENLTNINISIEISNLTAEKNEIDNNLYNMQYTYHNNNLNLSNYTLNIKPVVKIPKIRVGFLFPKLSNFMVATGDVFINSDKYQVYFLTKSPKKRELKFDKNIKRKEVYFKRNSIEEILKKENISFLIVSDQLPKDDIKWLKSLGIKLIGVSDDDNVSKDELNYTSNLKEIELFNAHVSGTVNNYNTYKKLNHQNSILIPNMINLKSTSKRKANLSSQNLLMLGELNATQIINPIIKSMSNVFKEAPTAKLNVFSPDKPSKELIDLIKDLNITDNIIFNPLHENISDYLSNTSIFLYASRNDNYQDLLIEVKTYGIPCVMFSDFPSNYYFKRGIFQLDVSNKKELSEEISRLINQNRYRNIIGKESRSSLDIINDNLEMMWYRLFKSLKNGKDGEKEFQKLKTEIEDSLKLINN